MALVKIQLRHDASANWTTADTLLLAGEVGCETDTGKLKVGDGVRRWTALPYVSPDAGSFATVATSGSYNDLSDKPTVQSLGAAPLSHTHGIAEVTGLQTELDGKADEGSPQPPTAHTHGIADVTGLQAELDTKADASNLSAVATSGSYNDLSDKPTISGAVQKENITDLTTSPLDLQGQPCLFANVYSTLSDLPSASTYHGMFAHVHAEGAAYYAHNGQWVRLLNASEYVAVSNDTIDARVASLIVSGDGIDTVYDDTAGSLTISASTVQEYVPDEPQQDQPDPGDPAPPPVALSFIAEPPPEFQVSGDGLSLSVEVTDVASPSYQWQYYNFASASWEDFSDTARITGSTSDTLVFSSTLEEDSDTYYRCVVSDGSSQIISSSTVLRWVLDAPALLISSDLPESAEVTRGSDGSYDLSAVLRVEVTGGTGNYRYQWAASTISGSEQYGFGRGALWQNLSAETGSTLSDISDANVIWLQQAADNSSLEEEIIFVRCTITDVTDSFTLTGPTVTSSECRVVVHPPLAAFDAQPADSPLNADGTASFSADYTGRAATSWEYQDPTGAISATTSLGSAATTGLGGESFRSTLSLTGLTQDLVGSRFRLRLTAADGTSSVVSDWAYLSGTPTRITRHPEPQTAVVAGQPFTLSFAYSPTAGSSIAWETRADFDETPTTVAGATSTTLSVASATATAEYRAVVTSSSGVARTNWALVAVIPAVSDIGDAAFTENLQPGAIYEDGTYVGRATSTLLTGANAVEHYAVVSATYADGSGVIAPLTNGVDVGLGPLRKFLPNVGMTHYNVNIQLQETATVRVLVTTNPHLISGTQGNVTGSPWARIPGYPPNHAYSREAFFPTIPFPQESREIRTTSVPTQYVATVTYPLDLYGFQKSQETTVAVQRQEAFYGPTTSVVRAIPQAYSFRGAANASGTVVVAPHVHPDVVSMYSDDQGRTWGTAFLPYSCQAYDVVYYANKFYLLTRGPDGMLTMLSSSDGRSWSQTGWNFGLGYGNSYNPSWNGPTLQLQGPTYSPTDATQNAVATRASVANGALYVATLEDFQMRDPAYLYSVRYTPGVRSALWRYKDGSWSRRELPGLSGVVTGTSTYLVSGQCYSTNDGVTWSSYPGAAELPAQQSLLSIRRIPDAIDKPWQMREVFPAPSGTSTYYISQNRPDDQLQYHYTSIPSQPGARLSYLASFSSLVQYAETWSPAIGPPVGNYLYCLGNKVEQYERPKPQIFRIDARTPTAATGPEVAAVLEDVGQPSFSGPFSIGNSAESLYRGGYQYGPREQLDLRYLDGTWSPNGGSLIFCRDRVLALFRPHIPSAPSSGGVYTVRHPTRR